MASPRVGDYLRPLLSASLQPFRGYQSVQLAPPAMIVLSSDEKNGPLGLLYRDHTGVLTASHKIVSYIHNVQNARESNLRSPQVMAQWWYQGLLVVYVSVSAECRAIDGNCG